MWTLWAVKGGSGVTVTATAFAAMLARRRGPTVLVDLGGDVPAALGMSEPSAPGVVEWLAAADASAEALARLQVVAGPDLWVLPYGDVATSLGVASVDRADALVDALGGLGRQVVIDAGPLGGAAIGVASAVLHALTTSGTSVLVTRACYLSLRRALRCTVSTDGAILVAEPGRSLDRRDVHHVLGVPVMAVVEADPALARAVDAGLLARRPHRGIERALAGLT
jgi:MinD-like ATPase involved in chromosome partitioning or flagellar assembly